MFSEVFIGPDRLPSAIPADTTPPALADMVKDAKGNDRDADVNAINYTVAKLAARKQGWVIEVRFGHDLHIWCPAT